MRFIISIIFVISIIKINAFTRNQANGTWKCTDAFSIESQWIPVIAPETISVNDKVIFGNDDIIWGEWDINGDIFSLHNDSSFLSLKIYALYKNDRMILIFPESYVGTPMIAIYDFYDPSEILEPAEMINNDKEDIR